MKQIDDTLIRLWCVLTAGRARDERGDVPGWVMVTVLTIGLAIVLFQFAGPQLQDLLQAAFDKVK